MRILIYIPLWKRVTLFEQIAKNLSFQMYALESSGEYNFIVLCAIAPDDPDRLKHNICCGQYGFIPFNCSNDMKMGARMNAGVNYSLKYEYDYFMNMGSDDLIHQSLIYAYRNAFEQRQMFFGLKTLYFADLKTRRAIRYQYKSNVVIGAGRMIHRKVIEAMINSGKDVYDDNASKGLDMNSKSRICNHLGIKQTHVNVDNFPYIIDIKSDTNLHSYEDVNRHSELIEQVNWGDIMKYYPEIKLPTV